MGLMMIHICSIEDIMDTLDTEDTMDCHMSMEGRGGRQMLMLPLMWVLIHICSMDTTDVDTMVLTIRTTLDTTSLEDKQSECKQNTTTTSQTYIKTRSMLK